MTNTMSNYEKPVGRVQTVSGCVNPGDLGITLTHEHLIIDFRVVFKEPPYASDRYKSMLPIEISDLEWIRHNRTSNYDNLLLGNEKEAIDEALLFKNEGGATIVDVSNKTFGRDPLALKRISKATGLHIVMGSGYFVSEASKELPFLTEKNIADEIIREFFVGIDDTGVKIGIIGELGCTFPLKTDEKKILRGAALAQQKTGLPISIHPGQHPDSPFEILEILVSAGAKVDHVVIGHVERTLPTYESIERLAKEGCYVEFDAFGKEGYFSGAVKSDLALDIPNDNARINLIKNLLKNGYGKQVLISQDICTKDMMVTYGGYGYAHILKRAIPVMRLKGISEEEISMILCDNPQRMLSIF